LTLKTEEYPEIKMPITIVSKIMCQPGKDAEMVVALKAMQMAVSENEPGTTFFLVHKARKDPFAYYIVEQYESEEAGEAHGESAAFAASVELLVGVAAGPAEHSSMDLIE
jgi:quinol monooxygenase YgiN